MALFAVGMVYRSYECTGHTYYCAFTTLHRLRSRWWLVEAWSRLRTSPIAMAIDNGTVLGMDVLPFQRVPCGHHFRLASSRRTNLTSDGARFVQ